MSFRPQPRTSVRFTGGAAEQRLSTNVRLTIEHKFFKSRFSTTAKLRDVFQLGTINGKATFEIRARFHVIIAPDEYSYNVTCLAYIILGIYEPW